MASLVQLRGYVRDWLGTSSTRLSDSSLNQIINVSMREILRTRDLWFAEQLTTFAVTAGTNSYQYPSSPHISRIVSFEYDDPNDTSKMVSVTELSWDEFRALYTSDPTNTSGYPVHFAVYRGYIWLGPTPSTSFTANIGYNAIFVDLSADADFNNLTVYGWEVLLFWACAYACKYMLEDERAPMFEALARKHLFDLTVEHNRQRDTVKPWPQMQEPS